MGTVDTGTGNGEAVYRSVAAAPKCVQFDSLTSYVLRPGIKKSQMPETQGVVISWSERIDMCFEVESAQHCPETCGSLPARISFGIPNTNKYMWK